MQNTDFLFYSPTQTDIKEKGWINLWLSDFEELQFPAAKPVCSMGSKAYSCRSATSGDQRFSIPDLVDKSIKTPS